MYQIIYRKTAQKALLRLSVAMRTEFRDAFCLAENQIDNRAFDAAIKSVEAGEELIPSAVVDRLAEGESPLKVWREYRGFALKDLAGRLGVAESCLMQMENGREAGSVELLTPLTKILQVDVDDLDNDS